MAQSKYELLLRPDANQEIFAGRRNTNVVDIWSLINLFFWAEFLKDKFATQNLLPLVFARCPLQDLVL